MIWRLGAPAPIVDTTYREIRDEMKAGVILTGEIYIGFRDLGCRVMEIWITS